jgi:mannose-6-phosphate isomerase-like protein (cupin superfamily)
MQKTALSIIALLAACSGAMAQNQTGADHATVITNDQVQAVLKSSNSTDKTLQVFELGSIQMSVAVVHRGRTAPAAATPARAATAATGPRCGVAAAPAGAQEAPVAGMIAHSDTVETYIVISGGGTLVTGGQIVNGTPSAPDAEVTRILNGPSCSGRAFGDIQSRPMKVGDIAVIPAGLPHGWTAITDEVTYLSVRPDPKKVLQAGYVNPALK